jgi:hypothetical protein
MTKNFIIASVLVCSSLLGQTAQRSDSSGTVTILTDPSGADLFIDSTYVGKSPLQHVPVLRGSHRIKAFYPSVLSWNATIKEEPLEVTDTGNCEKHLVLEKTLAIQTDPPDGTVLNKGKYLGVTPLYVRGNSMLDGNLVIQKSGYDSLTIPSGELKEGFLRLQLRPAGGLEAALPPSDLRGPDVVATDHWPTYVSGLAMIISGVSSAYYKDQANKEFDRYLLSNNPAGLSTTNKLDRKAAISLVISQISFVVLSYLLLRE